MLNRAPIFLHCFSRGGSNILWNAFLTHPDVCSPILETLDIFSLSLRKRRVEGFVATLMSRQPRFFGQWNLTPRSPLPKVAQGYIDRVFYRWKLKTLRDAEMRYKYEDEIYTPEEVGQARLVAKNNNGLAFLSDVLLDMYPEATFVALVRNPVALYESHRRRGLARSPEHFADYYSRIAGRMVHDAERLPRYFLWRFEDFMVDPVASIQQLYAQADLDAEKVCKLRFKAKPHYQDDGAHISVFEAGRHYWFDPDDVHTLLNPDINSYHIDQLPDTERAALLDRMAPTMQALGYAPVLNAS